VRAARSAGGHPPTAVTALPVTPSGDEIPGAPDDLAMLLSIEEAARVLNVPENWLRKKVSAHEVPHTRLGKHVRFTRAHLDQIVSAGEQPVAAVTRLADGVSRRTRRSG
jgi:excisionase family DNA binding protein